MRMMNVYSMWLRKSSGLHANRGNEPSLTLIDFAYHVPAAFPAPFRAGT